MKRDAFQLADRDWLLQVRRGLIWLSISAAFFTVWLLVTLSRYTYGFPKHLTFEKLSNGTTVVGLLIDSIACLILVAPIPEAIRTRRLDLLSWIVRLSVFTNILYTSYSVWRHANASWRSPWWLIVSSELFLCVLIYSVWTFLHDLVQRTEDVHLARQIRGILWGRVGLILLANVIPLFFVAPFSHVVALPRWFYVSRIVINTVIHAWAFLTLVAAVDLFTRVIASTAPSTLVDSHPPVS